MSGGHFGAEKLGAHRVHCTMAVRLFRGRRGQKSIIIIDRQARGSSSIGVYWRKMLYGGNKNEVRGQILKK